MRADWQANEQNYSRCYMDVQVFASTSSLHSMAFASQLVATASTNYTAAHSFFVSARTMLGSVKSSRSHAHRSTTAIRNQARKKRAAAGS